jgi:hypothetical protein
VDRAEVRPFGAFPDPAAYKNRKYSSAIAGLLAIAPALGFDGASDLANANNKKRFA